MGSDLPYQCAIVGVGETALVQRSPASVAELAMEAVLAALADAGLSPADVDAVITDNEIVPPVLAPNEVAANLGIRQAYSVLGPSSGAGQTVAPLLASMAMRQGLASVFVCYLVLDFGSLSPGAAEFKYVGESTEKEEFEYPFGFIGTPVYYAMAAKRYQALYGLTEAQLGAVAVTVRNHGARHPNAQMRRPVTLEDYFKSPYVSEPLRVLDCCLRTKAAGAFVITSLRGRASFAAHRSEWPASGMARAGHRAVPIGPSARSSVSIDCHRGPARV